MGEKRLKRATKQVSLTALKLQKFYIRLCHSKWLTLLFYYNRKGTLKGAFELTRHSYNQMQSAH